MVELAANPQGDPMSIKEIAVRQDLSPKYLEQLFSALQAAGLVTAIRGAQGGYCLSRSPDQISLRDIYFVFEGRSGFVPCADGPEGCDRADACVLAWKGLRYPLEWQKSQKAEEPMGLSPEELISLFRNRRREPDEDEDGFKGFRQHSYLTN